MDRVAEDPDRIVQTGILLVKDKDLRPWLSVIAGAESLVSHTGGVLPVETARCSDLVRELPVRRRVWRRPLAIYDPGKIVIGLG